MEILSEIGLGLIVGVLIGLTGIGGGALMTPALVILLGKPVLIAIGIDFVFVTVTKFFGVITHVRQKTVEWGLVKYLLLGSLPGALVSIFGLYVLKNNNGDLAELWLKKALAITLIFVATALLYRLIRNVRIPPVEKVFSLARLHKVLVVLVGFVTGLIVGFTSVGSGALIMLFLIIFFPLPPSHLVGTDITHGLVLALVASAGFLLVLPNIEWNTVFWLLLGSSPGVLLGSRLSLSISGRFRRLTLIGVLFVAGISIGFS